MTTYEREEVFELEKGWSLIQQGITKMKHVLEGETDQQFTSQEYMSLYTTVYSMCIKNIPYDYSQHLCNRYKEFLEDCMNSKVFPALRAKHEEYLLKELVKRWGIHKLMVRWLSNMFGYLNRYYIPSKELPKLSQVGMLCFRDLVYAQIKVDVKNVVIAFTNRDHEGEQIDKALLENVLDICVEIGIESYTFDFESFMLLDTSVFYGRKASLCIQNNSCPDYMTKVEACLNRETERVGHYLHASSEQKLVETVQQELLIQYENQILEKEHSRCQILFRDEKIDDLLRVFRLFSKILNGLEPIVSVFTQHVIDKGIALVKQADDEICEKKDKVGVQEHAFIQKIIDLHDKYLECVTTCFIDHHLFYKALKEAFEVFCNKSVAGNTSAELLALYCDNLLKKRGGEKKLNEEQIENTLEKVVKVLALISDKDLFAEFCRKKLARRLLFGVSASIDYERSILTKFKQLCGGQYTSKMESMVTDITFELENQSNFKKYLTMNTNSKLSIDMNTTVLNTLQWPNYKTSALPLPVEMEKCVTIYNKFYKTKILSGSYLGFTPWELVT